MTEPKLTPGTLYIDRDRDVLSGEWGQYVKIGIVRNDKEASLRNKEHQTGNPRRIYVIYSVESPMVEHLETQLHHRFAIQRILGEWFHLDDNAVKTEVIPLAEKIIQEQKKSLEAFKLRASIKSVASSGISREPNDYELAVHRKVIEAKHALDILLAKQEVIKDKLFCQAQGFNGIEGVLELQQRVYKPVLRKSSLRGDYPELYAQYEAMVLSDPKGLLAIKGTKTLKKLDADLYKKKEAISKSSAVELADIDNSVRERDSTIIDQHRAYLEGLGYIASADWLYESLKTELAMSLGDDDEIKGLIAWKRAPKEETKFDSNAFAKDHPTIYHEYLSAEKTIVASVISPTRPYI